MTHRTVIGASISIVLTCGLSFGAPAHAQTRDASLLPPEESGVITVAGCLQRGGKDGDKFVLASPQMGPIASVPDDTCSASVDERALELDDADDHGINQSMIGRWVEINGRLERETSTNPENLREMSVRSFRILPVVPPIAEAAPAPVSLALETPTPAPAAAPVATTGTVEPSLPRTASPLAALGWLGVLSLAGAFGLRLRRSQR